MCQGRILMSEFFGVGLFQIRPDSVHVGGGLGGSDARLQMSHRLKNAAVAAARVQKIFPIHLCLVHDGHKEIG